MHYKITAVGFYESMGPEQVQYILNQTEMTSIFVAKAYIDKILEYKRDVNGNGAHLSRNIVNLVCLDEVSA